MNDVCAAPIRESPDATPREREAFLHGQPSAKGVTANAADRPDQPRCEEVDIGRLFDEQGAFLLRVVRRLAASREGAEDIVQEVFMVAQRKRAELVPDTNLKAWLYRVAVNLIRHDARSFARLRVFQGRLTADAPAAATLPDEELDRSRLADRVRACIARLPWKQREVFVLYELEELEGPVISGLLAIPENTVWSRLRHARRRFQELWTREEAKRREGGVGR